MTVGCAPGILLVTVSSRRGQGQPSSMRVRWMRQDDRTHAWLPPERAFVVHFYAEPVLETTHMAGRVEHVVSGQATHFHSLPTLLAFITRVLLEGERAGEAEVE
jgi:hypothetical protein